MHILRPVEPGSLEKICSQYAQDSRKKKTSFHSLLSFDDFDTRPVLFRTLTVASAFETAELVKAWLGG